MAHLDRLDRSAARTGRAFARLAGAALAALLFLALAPAAEAQFGKNKIQYRDFDWKLYSSPHFTFFYYESEADQLEKVASLAESAYDRLTREFDHQIQDPIPMIFYLTHSAFEQNNIILNFIPEGVGAFATPVRNRMVLPIDLPDGELFALILHELTHIFQYDILYAGKVGRGVGGGAPQWFMEGMASYMAKDESTSDKMYLRDAVVNDSIPSILQRGTSGFLAYRFGHAAFDFIEERWGKEGFRDFLFEFRNTFGGRADRAVERSFRIDPEDFDLDFRRWLRKKYLPQLVETGEPSDFGRPFRDDKGEIQQVLSPAASPSGDLVAALAVTRGDLDIVLYDTRTRRPIANLTKGYTGEYEYLGAQFLTIGARMGRDISFSADGNYVAAFAKRERGRSLMIFDVLERKLVKTIEMEVEQQMNPAFSPDGRTVAFSGNRAGRFDIYTVDLETREVTNVTDDETYDGAPVFSPDGASIVFTSVIGENDGHLFRVDLANRSQRYRLTEGNWTDKDAIYSSNGTWLVFTSDRTGIDNIYAMELATGRTLQLTNAVTGCLMPTVLKRQGEIDQVVYAGFWRGGFDLYLVDIDKPVADATIAIPPAEPTVAQPLEQFEPDIRVTLDEANRSQYRGFKLFVEDAGASVGVTDDQTLLGYTYLSLSDYLGDRRLVINFSSVSSFSNFDVAYFDLSHRWTWSVQAFDRRDFYVLGGISGSPLDREERQQAIQQTGAQGSFIYPFSLYHRVSAGAGYIFQKADLFTGQVVPDENGNPVPEIQNFEDEYPYVTAALVGDSAVFTQHGPVSGRRWRLDAVYAFDQDAGGALYTQYELEMRQYLAVSQRSNLALRLYTGYAGGNEVLPLYFGGLDDLRGVDFRSMVGDRVFYTNIEYRFPLIDVLATPLVSFRGVRGRVFLDVGGAWFDVYGQDFDFWNSEDGRLQDAVSSYGFGVTINLMGIDLNWDFAQLWDFKDSLDDSFGTQFWIGTRF
ncbi:MAG: PD40 domain-containing protein [Thermoanaerobaculia bacterium]|nr:PD40 domain-containing protein [Thermoanaerobaculia bacterium]